MTDIKYESDSSLDRVLIYVGDGGHYLRQERIGYTTAQNAGVFTREQASALMGTFGPEKRCELRKVPADHIPSLFATIAAQTERAEKVEAERDALAARVAELEGALVVMLESAVPHPVEHPTMTEAWSESRAIIARTPAQSLARVKAAVLRELIAEADKRRGGIVLAFGYVSAGDILGIAIEMADRLEAEAANG